MAVLVFGFASYVVLRHPANHDLSWFQHAAAQWLDGAQPYVDFIEVNPPLILELHLVAELLSRLTGLWNMSAFLVLVLGLAAGSLRACHALLRYGFEERATAAHLLTVVLTYLLIALPGNEFGQRDHIAVVMTLPWILLTGVSTAHRPAPLGRGGRLTLGAAAGLGFALKPHFLLAWALVGLVVVLRSGIRVLLRAEHVALITIGALYVLSVPVIAPGYLFVARLALDSYGAFRTRDPWSLLAMAQPRLAMAALVFAAVAFSLKRWRAGAHASAQGLPLALAAALVGFAAAVLLQRRGWTYHWIPMQVCAGLLTGVVAVTLLPVLGRRLPLRWSGHVRVFASTVVTIGVLWLTARGLGAVRRSWQQMIGPPHELAAMLALVERAGPKPSFAALTMNMGIGFPLVSYSEARWVLRFNSLWPLVSYYERPRDPDQPFPYHARDDMEPAERFMFDSVISDLTVHRPTLLIVETWPRGYLLAGFELLQYFGQDAGFEALLSEYRELAPIKRYRVFYREDA